MMKLVLAAAAIVAMAATAVAQEKDDLAAAGKKSAELKSFAFKGETRVELPAMIGMMGEMDPVKFDGRYESGVGSYIKTDTHEFITVGKNSVTRPLSEWKKVEEESDDPMAMQKSLMKGLGGSRGVKAPSGDLADLGKKIGKTKKKDATDNDCTVYEAELTEEAAEEMVKDSLPMGRMMRMLGDATHSGSIKAWVDKDGRIVKYELTGRMNASLQGMELELSSTKTVTLSGIDSTKVEVPEDAKKALEK